MKKLLIFLILASMLTLSGCQTVAKVISPKEEQEDAGELAPEPEINVESEEPVSKIPLSKTLHMNNEWSIMGDYEKNITNSGQKDRIVLATSAQSVNGEMQWDDSQYWTLAVITEFGAYNLFYQRVSGLVYAEVSEAYVQGMATPIIVAYIFSGADREIRTYTYSKKEDVFVENQVFSTRVFSTGGICNLYSTFPDYKAR